MNNIAAVVKKRKGKLIREGKEKKVEFFEHYTRRLPDTLFHHRVTIARNHQFFSFYLDYVVPHPLDASSK